MAYQKINFLDQDVERPRTYEMQENSDGTVTLVDSFGIITEIGTPINRENMNHIEDGIVEVENSINTKILGMLEILYPVGSIYLTTTTTCPLFLLIPNSNWQLVSSGKALWTGNGTNGNTTISAGLPNITGGPFIWRTGTDKDSQIYGAMAVDRSVSNRADTADDEKNGPLYTFDASRSNSIYGQSDTVQPPAYVINVFRRIA